MRIFASVATNVEDVGPTMYKCYTYVLCFLGDISNLWTAFIQRRFIAVSNVSDAEKISVQRRIESLWPAKNPLEVFCLFS